MPQPVTLTGNYAGSGNFSISTLPTTCTTCFIDNHNGTATFNPSEAGTVNSPYTITYSYQKGDCPTYSYHQTVKVVAPPTATISGTAIICNGSPAELTVTLTGEEPWSITYTDGTTPVTINKITNSPVVISVTPSANTNYELTAVSDANCQGTFEGMADITVNTTTALTVDISSSNYDISSSTNLTLCPFIDPGTFTASVTTGGSGYSYQWYVNGIAVDNATQSTYDPGILTTLTTNIYCAVTNNVCTANSPTITITIDDFPTVSISPILQLFVPVIMLYLQLTVLVQIYHINGRRIAQVKYLEQ